MSSFEKGNPATFIDDESALALIKRSVKQHKDSIEQFQTAGRTDLVDQETAELKVMESYLPAQMTKEQIGYFAYKHTDHHLRQFNS